LEWLTGWRLVDLVSFDAWAGRHLRAWWLRWTVYTPKLPGWLHACGLSTTNDTAPVMVSINLAGRKKIHRDHHQAPAQLPKVLGVRFRCVLGMRSRSAWWRARNQRMSTRVARALASARGVQRCQVRELTPNVVSVDFQRRNLLAEPVVCPDLTELAGVEGRSVDLRRVFSGRTEYGQDWHVPLVGGHTLVVGSSGAGKNSVMWCPLVSIAPAIRDGLVRVSGIDPKAWNWPTGGGSSPATPSPALTP